jgi:hypothetical protein
VLHSVPEEQRAKETVKDVLNRHLDLGPTLFEHCLLCAGLKPGTKVAEYGPAHPTLQRIAQLLIDRSAYSITSSKADDAKTEALHQAISHAESLYNDPTLKVFASTRTCI